MFFLDLYYNVETGGVGRMRVALATNCYNVERLYLLSILASL